MNRITCKGFVIGLLILLSTGHLKAQYLFTQSFSHSAILAKSGWYVGSQHGTTFRDTVNGYAVPGEGSVHVSFNDLAARDKDTLRLPAFAATGLNDSLRFDHAHRGTRDLDSMSVFYSLNGGATLLLLHTFVGSETPDSSTLSTVFPTTAPGKFRPASSADWATKRLALPTGTNAVMFVFHSAGGDELYLDNMMIGQQPLFCGGAPLLAGMPSTIVSCAGKSFYIIPDTFEVNPLITYEWKRSLDNGVSDAWTTVTNGYGANTPEFYLTNFSQAYWYRLEATCGSQSFSPSVFVTFDSSFNCYCRTDLGGFCNAWITGVQLGANLNNTSNCPGGSSVFTFYAPGTGTTDTLTAGDPYASIAVSTDLFGSWLKARVGFWIDYNRDGMYDSTEFNMIKTAAGTETSSFQFAVPANAKPGITGLRVRAAENGSFFPAGSFVLMDGRHACTNGTSGETEEYMIYINPASVCASAPVAGTLRDTVFTVCQGTSLSFSVDGASFGPDITYQWEESTDDGQLDPWDAITGANALTYKTPALAGKMHYRLKVECTSSSMSSYTSSIEANVNPFYTCYCSTNLGGDKCNSSTAYISNVSVANTTINNTTTCSNNASSYSRYDTSATTSDTVYNEQLMNISVTNTRFSGRVAVWIDYDHSGTYDAREFTLITAGSVPTVATSGFILIPAGAANGLTGMRVRLVNTGWQLDSADACSNLTTGETEDYIINIQPAPPCNGNPVTGSYPQFYALCSGAAVSINAPGASYGAGITYLWQQSTDGVIWGNVTTGTGYDSRQFTSVSLIDSVYYRLGVTCNNTSSTIYGDSTKVIIKPFYTCYCTKGLGAGYSCTSGEYMENVSFVGGNLNVTSTCNTPNVDDSYTYNSPVGAATDSVTAGNEVIVSVRYRGTYPSRIAAWIDYNQNGVFEKSEFSLISSNAPSGTNATGAITIPVNATLGYTGMRIRATNFSAGLDSADACSFIGDGETEDYVIYIRPSVPCNSSVAAGTIPTSQLMCPGKDFTIIPNGTTVGSGIVYSWQESDDNGTNDAWDAISGSGNTKTVEVAGILQGKYYRLKVTCTNTLDSVFTNSMQVFIDSFYNCYNANTDLGGGMCNNDYISNVSIDATTLNNSSLCNNTPKGARTVFPASGNTTATLVAGMTYTINVTPNFVKSMGVWIDFNRNGVYEASEFKLINQRSNVKSSAAIIVPANAVTGLTGMRVRTSEPRAISFPVGGITAGQFANKFTQGETEDYVILIDSLKPATGVTATEITGTTVTVSWINGNGNGRLVIAKEDTTALGNPVNGTSYRADVFYASGNNAETAPGNYSVYESDRDTFVTVEGLDSNRSYNFYVYEYISAPRRYFVPGQSASATTLPVNLLGFSGKAVKNDVQLNWSTASEKNNKGFEVQRSADGRNFDAIGFVNGNGNRPFVSHYVYTDKDAFANGSSRLFYRLKQVDFNGASSNSERISVSNGTTTGITVTPNPFADELVIWMNNNNAPATVRITDMLGHIVRETKIGAQQNNIELETSDLADGVYFVNVQAGTELYRYKIVRSGNVK